MAEQTKKILKKGVSVMTMKEALCARPEEDLLRAMDPIKAIRARN